LALVLAAGLFNGIVVQTEEGRAAVRSTVEPVEQLVEGGAVLCKFWLSISSDEQLRRFESRRDDPERSWKLTDEDWRNREKWGLYQEAASEMIVRTSTAQAPWTVVATNSKKLARVKVLSTVGDAIEAALSGSSAPNPAPEPRKKKTDTEKRKKA